MVQNEFKRRRKFWEDKATLCSSKYALTEIAFCGECGAKYRRVTWSKKGKKKIVWRCIERLKNGTKNCKNSPSNLEGDLHVAIIKSIEVLLTDTDSIATEVQAELNSIINEDKTLIRQTELDMNDYINLVVRSCIESILIISDSKIKVVFFDGT